MIQLTTKVDISGLEELTNKLKQIQDVEEDRTLITNITVRAFEILSKNNSTAIYKFSSKNSLDGEIGFEIIDSKNSRLFNTSKIAMFQEFGTGVVGRQTPIPSEYLASAGWKYGDKEQGWVYPTDETDPNPTKFRDKKGNWYAHTKGQVGQRIFIRTLEQLKAEIPKIVNEYLNKIGR